MKFTDPRVTAHARAMSDALIKVRPLGGSEMFTRIRLDGDDEIYLADAEFCGKEIDRMHRERRELKRERADLLKALEEASLVVTPDEYPATGKAIRTAIEAAGGNVWWKP